MAYQMSGIPEDDDYIRYSRPTKSEIFEFNTPERYMFPVERVPRRLTPQMQEYRAKGNAVITFDIPNDAILHLKKAMLFFNMRLTKVGGTYVRMHSGVWNAITRLRHLANNRKVEEVVDYNDVTNLQWRFHSDPDTESTLGQDLYGIETQAQRNIWGADPLGQRFACPIRLGMLTSGPFPGKFLKERHQLEIHINDPLACVETDGASPDIIISDIRLYVDVLKDALTPRNSYGRYTDSKGFEQTLKDLVESGDLQVHYDSWDTFQNQVFGVNHDLVIGHRAKGLKEFVGIFRNDTARFDTTVNDRLDTYPKLNLSSFQWRINGAYFPDIPVECTGRAEEAYQKYLDSANALKFVGFIQDMVDNPNVTLDDFNLDSFGIFANMRPSSEHAKIGTISTLNNAIDPQINVKFTVAPPAGHVLVIFSCYTTIAHYEAGTTRVVICE